MTTPFKQPNHGSAPRLNQGGTQLFAVDEEMEDMLPSPPRPNTQKIPSARLFDDDYDNVIQRPSAPRTYTVRNRPSPLSTPAESFSSLSDADDIVASGDDILRQLDVNNSGTAHSDPTPQRRKRPSEQYPAGKEEIESGGDMFVSPRISPTYTTLDGRTVTSKNPFSPYPTPGTAMDDASSDASMQAAPEFPMSLATTSLPEKNEESKSHLPAHISLRRRDKHGISPFKAPPTYRTSTDGFPAQQGQYSFTGSPIEELSFLEDDYMGAKVRKLKLEDSASRGGNVARRGLFVDTDEVNLDTKIGATDKISPNDVMNFPPPTPKKGTRPPTRYTPVQSVGPKSPTRPTRRPFADSDDEAEEHHLMGTGSSTPKSRFNQDFDIIGQLGDGSFGTVYKCLSRLDGCMYAVKAAKRKAKGIADRDNMLREVYALAALSDQADTAAFHIVRYHQAWMEDSRLYIQTELCSSTLHEEMKKGLLTVKRRYKVMREILVALEFVHRNKMVHCDIKPENIFVKNDQYKLGDFGLVSKSNSGDVEEGDSRYMSIELLSFGSQADLTKCDIFSFGATMYEICLARPLPMNGQEWQDIRNGSLQPLQSTPFQMELMIKEMMAPKPEDRPRPSDLLKRQELLSEEQKQLIAEKHKVLQANMALALQTQRMKKLTPPRRGGLMRANTWSGGSLF